MFYSVKLRWRRRERKPRRKKGNEENSRKLNRLGNII
jgi:hypothetical protein